MGEKPDGACRHSFVGVGEDLRDCWNGFLTVCFEGAESKEAGVHGGALKSSDRAFDGLQVKLRNVWFEAFGSNAVDGAGAGIIAVAVATDAGVIPIGDVKSSIRADDDVGGAEEDLGVVWIGTTADEVGAGIFLVGVGGGEVGLFEFEGGALGLGLVVEDRVFSGFAGEEGAVVALGEGSIFIHADAGG